MIGAAREGGWDRVVAVFQPHRYTRTAALWRDFADAFVDADARVLTDVYAAGEQPQPGVSGPAGRCARCSTRTPSSAVAYLPRRADLVAHVPRLARPGDLVLTLGAGDLTTVPDEWLAPRPCEPATSLAARPRRAPSRVRVERDVPVADLTTYHLGGPVAVLVRAPTPAELGALADALAGDAVPPVLVVGRGSNLLVADRGFAGPRRRARRRRSRRSTSDADGHDRAGRGARCRCRARPPDRGRRAARASSSSSGSPAASAARCGMNAGGHGRETADVLLEAEVADLAAGGTAGRPSAGRRSTSATAVGDRARPTSWSAPSFRVRRRRRRRRARPRSPRSCAGGASTSPAARTRARCSATRRATPPGASSTPRASRASGSAARSCRRSTPTSSRPRPGATADDVRDARARGAPPGARRDRASRSCPSCAWSGSTTPRDRA